MSNTHIHIHRAGDKKGIGEKRGGEGERGGREGVKEGGRGRKIQGVI